MFANNPNMVNQGFTNYQQPQVQQHPMDQYRQQVANAIATSLMQRPATQFTGILQQALSANGYNNQDFQFTLEGALDLLEAHVYGGNANPNTVINTVATDAVDSRAIDSLYANPQLANVMDFNESNYYTSAVAKRDNNKNFVGMYRQRKFGNQNQMNPTFGNGFNNQQNGNSAVRNVLNKFTNQNNGFGNQQYNMNPFNNGMNGQPMNMGMGTPAPMNSFGTVQQAPANPWNRPQQQSSMTNAFGNTPIQTPRYANNGNNVMAPKGDMDFNKIGFSSPSANTSGTVNNVPSQPVAQNSFTASSVFNTPKVSPEQQERDALLSTLQAHGINVGTNMPTETLKSIVGSLGSNQSTPTPVVNAPVNNTPVVESNPLTVAGKTYATQEEADEAWCSEAAKKSKSITYFDKDSNPKFVGEKKLAELRRLNPGVEITKENIEEIMNNTPPYPFCFKDDKGRWVTNESGRAQIKLEKRGHAIHPVLTDGESYILFVIDDNGYLIEGYRVPFNKEESNQEENDMNQEQHDTSKWIKPTTTKDIDNAHDAKVAEEAFASLQVEAKISEVVEDLEAQAGVVRESDVPVSLEKLIHLEETVEGGLVGDNYWAKATAELINAVGENELDIDYSKTGIHFNHAHMLGWYLSGEELAVAKEVNKVEDYYDLADWMIKMLEHVPEAYVQQLNKYVTNYINKVMLEKLDMEGWSIDSFMLDIADLYNELSELDLVRRFDDTLEELKRTTLHIHDRESTIVDELFLDLFEEGDDDVGMFIVARDVTVLPIYARDLPLFGNSNKQNMVVAKYAHGKLWDIIDTRLNQKDKRVSETILVTTDNKVLYVNKTNDDDVYSITKESIFG